ncbi:hypothetical protein PHMEG_00032813, partial [Phytophthora megakarya]
NNFVPHLWSLSFINWRVTLCRLLEGIIVSSNDKIGGVWYPRPKVSCNVSTTDRTFQARSVADRASVLSVK